MSRVSRLSPETDGPTVVPVAWPTFLAFMQREWRAGQHLCCIGPTGKGKTTVIKPLLDLRNFVMVLDPKGMDPTLEQYGYVRLFELQRDKWTGRYTLPRKLANDIADGKPVRIILGGESDSELADAKLKELMRRGIEMVRQQGGWTVYADEFQVLADRRIFNLGNQVERHQITSRAKKTSVVTAFQAPAWVPKSATRQTTYTIIVPTRDFDMIKVVARSAGRDWQAVSQAVLNLPQWHDLVIPPDPAEPMWLIHPPPLD